jgi:hypothetical protein
MGRGLGLQAVLLTPHPEPYVGTRRILARHAPAETRAGQLLAHLITPGVVAGERRGELLVGLDTFGDPLGVLPLAAVRDQAQEPPRGGIRRVDEHGHRQVPESLGFQPARFTPESELDVGLGVAAGCRPG